MGEEVCRVLGSQSAELFPTRQLLEVVHLRIIVFVIGTNMCAVCARNRCICLYPPFASFFHLHSGLDVTSIHQLAYLDFVHILKNSYFIEKLIEKLMFGHRNCA